MRLEKCLGFLFAFLLLAPGAFAQTGKISGQVVDAQTGNPLPGVNVVVVGTNQGATTDVEGQYNILNVSPGTYDVRASFVGYTPVTQEGVDVNIDLTTEINFELQEQTEQLDEITVQAEERVIQRDVSANVANISSEDVENMPVADIQSVVSLQPGVQGMSIRGSSPDEIDFRVDGMSMSSGRNNSPYTNISYTSVQEVQVQTGGFNAEYGNIRSGLVNLVTREGPRNRYTVDVLARYSPATRKHFGMSPADPESYWMRPFYDEEVRWEGTGNWDSFTDNQYPDFAGFNEISENLLGDDDPSNDLTPEQLLEVFEYRHRKPVEISSPDYVLDGSFGGPVPGISQYLGDLRFFASYRQEDEQYIVPRTTEGYGAYNGRLKLTSNITPRMKLTVQQMMGQESGTNCTRGPYAQVCRDGNRMLSDWNFDSNMDLLFVPSAASLAEIERMMTAAQLTHTLGENTFYELRLQRYQSDYSANPVDPGDPGTVQTIGDYELDEAPYGYWYEAYDSEVRGLNMGGHTSEFRDTSQVTDWSVEFDVTSQLNQWNQVKGGVDFTASHNQVSYGHIDFLTNPDDIRASWDATPLYAAAYLQDKIEFRSMVANVGLRADYVDPNVMWWDFQDSPYTDAFRGSNWQEMEEVLEQEPAPTQWRLSPRLGMSFPITDVSKLYFNYGHFSSSPTPRHMFMLERMQTTNGVWMISNPSAAMPRTVAYELGYEQSLFDQYLVRISGYYKDISNQPKWVSLNSLSGLVDYDMNVADNYEDIRGVEFQIQKNVGRWVRGFVNYSYMVRSEGDFGLGEYFENPVEAQDYINQTGGNLPWNPLPQPYARISVDFMTPPDYGPDYSGFSPLGDWRLNLLGRWEAGNYFTWTANQDAPDVVNNMQWPSFRMVDARISKNVNVSNQYDMQIFADINNLFDIQNFNDAGAFEGSRDYESYLESLQYAEDLAGTIPNYSGIVGDDEPGDLPTRGAPYQEIQVVNSTSEVTSPSTEPLYYVRGDNGGSYMWYRNNSFENADEEFVNSVLENNQYIDPPNERSFYYLFPRNVSFGVRFSF